VSARHAPCRQPDSFYVGAGVWTFVLSGLPPFLLGINGNLGPVTRLKALLTVVLGEATSFRVSCIESFQPRTNAFPFPVYPGKYLSYGCASISTIVATTYDTLGESGLEHSLNEPECVGIFTNADLLPVVANVIAAVPSLRVIIYDGQPHGSVFSKITSSREGVSVLSLNALRACGRGQPLESTEGRIPSSDDVACIMYTSGTTGPPKGVVIKHSNLIAAIGAVNTLVGHHLKPDDMFLAFLPLAHILEYVVELCFVFLGICSGYGRVKTLTDQSVRNCKGDIKAFRPTIMVGVPAVWELIRKGILAQVNSSGAIRKGMFNGAMSIKKANVPVAKNVVDTLVFSKIKQATGGRLRLAMSGGAALSRETQEFLTLALVTVLQGATSSSQFGLTLTMGHRLWYDRELRRDCHPPTGNHAVWLCGFPFPVRRNQVPRRA
jgi:long-chain acyl-CoA synthetase